MKTLLDIYYYIATMAIMIIFLYALLSAIIVMSTHALRYVLGSLILHGDVDGRWQSWALPARPAQPAQPRARPYMLVHGPGGALGVATLG